MKFGRKNNVLFRMHITTKKWFSHVKTFNIHAKGDYGGIMQKCPRTSLLKKRCSAVPEGIHREEFTNKKAQSFGLCFHIMVRIRFLYFDKACVTLLAASSNVVATKNSMPEFLRISPASMAFVPSRRTITGVETETC